MNIKPKIANLKIDSQLVWKCDDYNRCIVGGYIKIKPQNR